MAEADDDFERARVAFRHAAEARTIAAMRIHAQRGMLMLERADALSAIVDFQPARTATASQDS